MKALSILQPWAWCIVRPDLTDPVERARAREEGLIKTIENRRWDTKFRGRFIVHAGKKWGREQKEDYQFLLDHFPELDLPPSSQLDRGGVVGEALMSDTVTESDSKYFFGPIGFVIPESRPLPFLPYRGELGWFNIPDELLLPLGVEP